MSYFEDLSPGEKQALQDEFNSEGTTRERRAEILGYLRDGANEAQMGRQCPRCKNYPFFATHDEALIEGHVYSGDGVRELQITGYCEFCFDLVTQEPDEEDDPVMPDHPAPEGTLPTGSACKGSRVPGYRHVNPDGSLHCNYCGAEMPS